MPQGEADLVPQSEKKPQPEEKLIRRGTGPFIDDTLVRWQFSGNAATAKPKQQLRVFGDASQSLTFSQLPREGMLPRKNNFLRGMVKKTISALKFKRQTTFTSKTWHGALFRRMSEVYSCEITPEEIDEVTEENPQAQSLNPEEKAELIEAIRYVHTKMNDREKKHGISRFDLMQLLALRPKSKTASHGAHDLYRNIHANIHTRCWDFDPECKITAKELDQFWLRRTKEEEFYNFVKIYCPGESLLITEGLIRVIERCDEWSVVERSLELLVDICIDSRPVIAFYTLIVDNGFARIWKRVRIVLDDNGDSDEASVLHSKKVKAWWNLVFILLNDAFEASSRVGTSNSENYFFDPMSKKKKSKRIVDPEEVVRVVWETYHPRYILYAMGKVANSNKDLLQDVVSNAWRILDLGALEFVAQRSVGGMARLRPVMLALSSANWSFDMSSTDARNQINAIKNSAYRLDSMLGTDAPFCLSASLYGSPFFVELAEWWIRSATVILNTPELKSITPPVSVLLTSCATKMENYVHFIYRGDEDTEDRDDIPIIKAREAHRQLFKPTRSLFSALTKPPVRIVIPPEPKPEESEVKHEKSWFKKTASAINVETENAWSALLRAIGKH